MLLSRTALALVAMIVLSGQGTFAFPPDEDPTESSRPQQKTPETESASKKPSDEPTSIDTIQFLGRILLSDRGSEILVDKDNNPERWYTEKCNILSIDLIRTTADSAKDTIDITRLCSRSRQYSNGAYEAKVNAWSKIDKVMQKVSYNDNFVWIYCSNSECFSILSSLEAYQSQSNHFIIPVSNITIAKRVANALTHLIKLNGGTAPKADPF